MDTQRLILKLPVNKTLKQHNSYYCFLYKILNLPVSYGSKVTGKAGAVKVYFDSTVLLSREHW